MDIQAIKLSVLENIGEDELAYGEYLFNNGDCTILSQSAISVDFMIRISGNETFKEYVFILDGDHIVPQCANERIGWNRYSYACLLQYEHELNLLEPGEQLEHKKYSRQGMMQRVLTERRLKAEKAKYHIKWAANIYGDHILTNEKGIRYNVFLRDFENETGYSNSMDAALNKLGTTKHVMYAFRTLKGNKSLYDSLSHEYPFIEIFCDPLNDYKISLYYPGEMPADEKLLISRYFGNSSFIEDDTATSLLGFIEEVAEYPHICVRPEVKEKIERLFEQKMLKDLSEKCEFDFSSVKAELFPYQKDGVKFVLFRKAAIIADEMGLGKTLQAIAAAMLKKELFGFKKTLIVCPATLKSQWKKEIEKFTSEKAHIISGTPQERKNQYLSEQSFFHIVNYEMVLRDSLIINKAGIDFLILDEAQKIKNYETKTSAAIRRLNPVHTLIITGTPIENRLIDIYAIMSVIDPYFFGPLWEFSYQHCLFDPERPDKINGYYNLQQLNKKLSEILIRREKRTVINQLPNVQQINIPVELSPLQEDLHGSFAAGIARIISKKFLTPFDLQRLQQLLTNMRMVCDSTYLIDDTTSESPKMEILKEILFEKIDLHHSDRKIIIFSEWVKVHKLIGQILRENKIGFVELTGKVPVALRGELIKKFESRPECKIFLSTEAGGAGLNLQVADILINFELPWNPAKKNQRIGRIDRLGQKSEKLTIYNFVTRNSIEQQIAAGLLVKQNLFEGVLDSSSATNYVDFSSKGRSQFIKQLEAFLGREPFDDEPVVEEPAEKTADNPTETDSNDLSQIELIEDLNDDNTKPEEEPSDAGTEADSKAIEMEQVMNNGMQFLAGLFKMSTGKDMGLENQKIEIDKETGEVVMRFKMKF
jgi:hypothetical protein